MKQGIQMDFPHESLRKSGCYFFTLLRWAEILKGDELEFSTQDVIRIFARCREEGFVEDDCFIVNPVGVLNFCLDRRRFKTVFMSKIQPTEPLYAVYLKRPGHGHFVLGGGSRIVWDSYDPNRPAAKEYSIDSFRVII